MTGIPFSYGAKLMSHHASEEIPCMSGTLAEVGTAQRGLALPIFLL